MWTVARGCSARRRSRPVTARARVPGDAPTLALPPELDGILTRAALAPSRHNEQPWRVTLRGADALEIRAKPALRLTVDRHGFAAPLALGGFTHNLRLAAARVGLHAESAVLDDRISVSLKRARPTEFPDELFGARVTPRVDFADVQLDAALIASLSEGARGLHFVPRASPIGERLAELTIEGTRAQLARGDVRAELARWVHLDDDDAERMRDGYTLASLGITGGAAFTLRTFIGASAFSEPRFAAKAVARTARHVARTPAFVVLTASSAAPRALVDAGEALQRLALRLAPAGLAMHPVAQAVEEGDPARLAAELGLSDLVVFVARVGRPATPPARQTLRRPIAAFVEASDDDA